MPLAPEEIEARRFPIALRGYEKDDVEGFLRRVAADYRAALSAISSAGDPYASLGHEVGNVLRSAKESAEALRLDAEEEAKLVRQKAADDAMEMRREAAEEAATTLESAREKAVKLSHEAERHRRSATEEAREALRQATRETEDMRRQAAEEATATLDTAADKADKLTNEAQRHSLELKEATERRCEEMLKEATERHYHLRAMEKELEERVAAVDQALARLRAELGTVAGEARSEQAEAEAPASHDPHTSQALADRLMELDPDLDQVAGAVADSEDEGLEPPIDVEGPSQEAQSARRAAE